MPAPRIRSRAFLPRLARSDTSVLSSPAMVSTSRSSIPADFRTCQYASAVTAKPLGILTPCCASSRYISPSEAFLPPTRGTSPIVISSNQRMYLACCLILRLSFCIGRNTDAEYRLPCRALSPRQAMLIEVLRVSSSTRSRLDCGSEFSEGSVGQARQDCQSSTSVQG